MISGIRLPAARLNEERSAFARGKGERRLRILIDVESVPKTTPGLGLLLEFATHPLVHAVTNQAHPGIPVATIGETHIESDVADVDIRAHDGSWSRVGIYPVSQYKKFAEEDAVRTSMTVKEVERRIQWGVVAEELHVDAFVTEPRIINESVGRNLLNRSNPVSTAEGLALLGLYLRSRDDFTIGLDSGSLTVNRGFFFWLLTRDRLHAAWRWYGACVSSSTATGDDTLTDLGGSVLVRIGRVLRARDRVHSQLFLPQNNDTADEALFYLDLLLVAVVGAFDAAARVTHLIYSLPGDRRYASWRSPGWLTELVANDAALANLASPGASARDVLDIAAILRNTIHGEALRSVHLRQGGHDPETIIVVPPAHQSEINAATTRLGGADAWGLKNLGGRWVLQPGPFVEQLIEEAVSALNSLMVATGVERLHGVDPASLSSGPPTDDWIWGPEASERIRLLGGLG